MDQNSIAQAVKQICDEKGITVASVVATIEAALAAAFRKDFGEKNQNIKVEFDLETGKSKVFDVKIVVEDMPEELLEEGQEEASKPVGQPASKPATVPSPSTSLGAANPDETETLAEEVRRFNPKTEIQLSDAKKIKKSYEIGDEIKTPLEIPGDFGRMAAQTAKQVIIQKLRETERETIFEEYKGREGEIVVGTIQRREGGLVLVDLGRITALLPPEEQIRSENYASGAHLKVYILSVNSTTKGPEIVVSRSHPEIVKKLFELEIPEIASGVVEIKAIAREAGSRTKIAVFTDQENIDPIGSCIGQRGARIQTIISELKGEKVDIIKYSEDPKEFIANALSPAKIAEIKIDEESKMATAIVAEDQLSLAIGRAGQNVRLAARLSGWKIDIVSAGGKKVEVEEVVEGDNSEQKSEISEPASASAGAEALTDKDATARQASETVAEEKPKKRGRPKKSEVSETASASADALADTEATASQASESVAEEKPKKEKKAKKKVKESE